jgi:hypothetical protein
MTGMISLAAERERLSARDAWWYVHDLLECLLVLAAHAQDRGHAWHIVRSRSARKAPSSSCARSFA